MFGIFKRSRVVRKSEDGFIKSETKWFRGQKVKIKSGTTNSRSFDRNINKKGHFLIVGGSQYNKNQIL